MIMKRGRDVVYLTLIRLDMNKWFVRTFDGMEFQKTIDGKTFEIVKLDVNIEHVISSYRTPLPENLLDLSISNASALTAKKLTTSSSTQTEWVSNVDNVSSTSTPEISTTKKHTREVPNSNTTSSSSENAVKQCCSCVCHTSKVIFNVFSCGHNNNNDDKLKSSSKLASFIQNGLERNNALKRNSMSNSLKTITDSALRLADVVVQKQENVAISNSKATPGNELSTMSRTSSIVVVNENDFEPAFDKTF